MRAVFTVVAIVAASTQDLETSSDKSQQSDPKEQTSGRGRLQWRKVRTPPSMDKLQATGMEQPTSSDGRQWQWRKLRTIPPPLKQAPLPPPPPPSPLVETPKGVDQERRAHARGLQSDYLCTNTCNYDEDGWCDDGGAGSEYSDCDYGTDCADCGSRNPAVCSDPLFEEQWHFDSTNILDAWYDQRAPGAFRPDLSNISVIVVDDGVDEDHPDLDVTVAIGWTADSLGTLVLQSQLAQVDRQHGTACTGIIAAIADNGIGTCGSAPGVNVSSAALLNGLYSQVWEDAEAESILYFENADIHTNSWGPIDNLYPAGAEMSPSYREALLIAQTTGRNGKGKIVLFAAGNGGRIDNSNHDCYTAHRFTIAVGAVNDLGVLTYYSEPGANILIVASSGGAYGRQGITTTDISGSDGYTGTDHTSGFSGTSAATPLAAGIVALMLAARPELTWRDVQAVLALSAQKNDETDVAWSQNAADLWVHPFYGFGLIDAAAAVQLATTWTLLQDEVSIENRPFDNALPNGTTQIPDDGTPWIGHVYINESLRLETVEIFVDVNHDWMGDLMITLISPGGTRSALNSLFAAKVYTPDPDPSNPCGNYETLPCSYVPMTPRNMSSVRYRNELSKGWWVLEIRDVTPTRSGYVTAPTLTLHGTATTDTPTSNRSSLCPEHRNIFRGLQCCPRSA